MIPLIIGGVALLALSKKGSSNNVSKPTTTSKTSSYNRFDNLFQHYAQVYGIDWKLVKRISFVESTLGLNPKVAKGLLNPNDIEGSKSDDGLSWGIMQMTLKTARDYDSTVTAIKLNNPEYSINLASRHIKLLMSYFTNERDIVMAYNHGQGNQKKFLLAEKSGTLKSNEYLSGRNEYAHYLTAKGILS